MATSIMIARTGDFCMLQDTIYVLKRHENWCLWNDFISSINDNVDREEHITFSVTFTPIGNWETLIEKENVGFNELTPCLKNLNKDIAKLFNNEEQSDFVLKCADRKFFVHKVILSARSDFFAAMFRSDMKESTDATGEIKDLEPDILEQVLRYIYTGKILNAPVDSIRKIYTAADMFLLELLKAKCYLLFIDSIITDTKEDSEKVVINEQSDENEQSKVPKEELEDCRERQLLKKLFKCSKWQTFSQEFPCRAQEMCKQYLLEKD